MELDSLTGRALLRGTGLAPAFPFAGHPKASFTCPSRCRTCRPRQFARVTLASPGSSSVYGQWGLGVGEGATKMPAFSLSRVWTGLPWGTASSLRLALGRCQNLGISSKPAQRIRD